MAATFAQLQSADPLYYLQVTYGPELGNYCIAYVPASAGVPSPVSLPDSWSKYSGVYLFLDDTPTNQTAFAANLAAYLNDPAYPNATFLWIANPNDPPSQWVSTRICVESGSTSVLGQWMMRNISLFAGTGCQIAVNSTGDGFTLTPPAAGSLYLTAMSGGAMLTGITTPLTISFSAGVPGCLLFGLTLDNASTTPDFDRLDTGICYFADEASLLGSGVLSSWRFPVFDATDPNAASLPMSVSVDPLNPLDGSRTYFSFVAPGAASGPTLRSYYVTNMGYRLSLTPSFPAGTDATQLPRFVLTVRNRSTQARPYDPFYPAPAGLFTVGVLTTKAPLAGADPVQRVVCGTSGLEYLGLTQGAGNLLYFFPGQPAYAANFSGGTSASTGLSPIAQTSWAYLTGPGATSLNYYAQPLDAALYQANLGSAFTGYLEICAGVLPGAVNTTGTPPTMFPMAPFGGIEDSDYADYLQLELQVLNPVRRGLIYQLAQAPTSPVTTLPVTGGTPQGLLVAFTAANGGGTDVTFTLARSTDNSKTVHELGLEIELGSSGKQSPLLAALQSNQLFLVISSQAMLEQYCSLVGSILTVSTQTSGNWKFDVFGDWTQHQTILIFKFGKKALGDLVNDITTWTGGAEFNTSVPATQTEIQQIIQAATQPDPNNPNNRVPIDPDFDYFVNMVVGNPEWTGILALNCNVPLTGLPDQIAGLAAGIDQSLFKAHHFGVNLTPLSVQGQNPNYVMELNGNSSLFGLIYYNDPADLVYNGKPYQFKVLTLKVLFANSTVTNFSSQIEINVSQLFAEGASSPDTGRGVSNLLLNGTYQIHGSTGSYQFLNNNQTLFTIDGHSLESVEVTQAQFVTVVAPDQVQKGQLAESKFLLWGLMKFDALTGFDMFSFGDWTDKGTTNAGGLSFSNLSIDLSYDPTQTPVQQNFAFDASHIAFDMAASTARPGSLYAGFPLSLSGFVQASGTKSPTDLGYLTVDAPIGQSSLSVPWFGLVMQLNLGSPGALAAQAGFTASLLAAWGPNKNSPSVSIGLLLPGTGGSKLEMAIESVVKLKIQRIKFMVDSQGGYVLLLNNISLSLLTLKFPPSGQTTAYLFGDPTDNTTLGWYAGYVKDSSSKKDQKAIPPGGKS